MRVSVCIAALAAVGVVGACSGSSRNVTHDRGDAVVVFETKVADAEVWIDGRHFEDALRRGIQVRPGVHLLEVRHDSYHTFFLELTLARNERRTVVLDLAEILP